MRAAIMSRARVPLRLLAGLAACLWLPVGVNGQLVESCTMPGAKVGRAYSEDFNRGAAEATTCELRRVVFNRERQPLDEYESRIGLGLQGNCEVAGTPLLAGTLDIMAEVSGNNRSQLRVCWIKIEKAEPPFIIEIDPETTTAGAPSFPLEVTGRNFVQNSVVEWQGLGVPPWTGLETKFISDTKLMATVRDDLVLSEGTAIVKVRNPDGQPSNKKQFAVKPKLPPVIDPKIGLNPPSAPENCIGLDLRVSGTGFTSTSVVEWQPPDSEKWIPLQTVLDQASEPDQADLEHLRATLPAVLLSPRGEAQVRVADGAELSMALPFEIKAPPTLECSGDGSDGGFNERRLTVDGGRGPYSWEISPISAPRGLALRNEKTDDGENRIVGEPEDEIRELMITTPDALLPENKVRPLDQIEFKLRTVDEPRAQGGQLRLSLAPAADLEHPSDDCTVQLECGSGESGCPGPRDSRPTRTTRISLNGSNVTFDCNGSDTLGFSTGTVAGTFDFQATLEYRFSVTAVDDCRLGATTECRIDVDQKPLIAPAPELPSLAPVIWKGEMEGQGGNLRAVITAYSTPRDITDVIVEFIPVPGASVIADESMKDMIREEIWEWYQLPNSARTGSQFRIPITLDVVDGDLEAVDAVSITFLNGDWSSNTCELDFASGAKCSGGSNRKIVLSEMD